MAIPFYEPRQQAGSECDQVDGHFPPAPSSQAVSLPTANVQSAASTTQEPTDALAYPSTGNASATANSSASTALRAPSTTSPTWSHSTSSASTASTSGISTPISPVTSYATTAFTVSSNNPSIAASFSTNPTTSTEITQTTLSSTAPTPSPTEPLPWKLLAVSMCKALKQYYQQTNSPNVFTTAIIEILPSSDMPTQSSTVGN